MLKVVHINKDKKESLAEELRKIIAAKWDRRDREAAEKKYGKTSIPNKTKKTI